MFSIGLSILNHLDGKSGLTQVGGRGRTFTRRVHTTINPPPRTTQETYAKMREFYPTDLIPRLTDSSSHFRKWATKVLADMVEPAFLPQVYAAYNPDRNMWIGALRTLAEFSS
ncbi:MAG: hypothetical protein WCF90_01680 [Methanomicrobiales archaeon]